MTNNIFIAMYSILIIIGFFSNITIIIVYVTKQVLATTQNLLIVNLAISDLLLCTLTMPMNIVELVNFYFPFPLEDKMAMEIGCKLVGSAQSTVVIFSSISVVLIAVDRYIFILKGHQGRDLGPKQISPRCAGFLSFFGFLISALLCYPVFNATHIATEVDEDTGEAKSFCYENWGKENVLWRQAYNIFCFVAQLLVPSIVVAVLYYRLALQ